MSTLRVANVHLESTGANFIDYPDTNTIRIKASKLQLNAATIVTESGATPGAINVQTFDSSGTWSKPSGYAAGSRVYVQVWSAGGSGGRSSGNPDDVTGTGTGSGGGGGGGGYGEYWTTLSTLGSTETVTVGAGGASITSGNNRGAVGGNSSFGLISVAGGGGGANTNTASTVTPSDGGQSFRSNTGYGGSIQYGSAFGFLRPIEFNSGGATTDGGCCGPAFSAAVISSIYSGGGGGRGFGTTTAGLAPQRFASSNGGGAIYGGGGGGGRRPRGTSYAANVGIGGASVFAGRGGNGASSWTTAGEAGVAPGGGGGGCAANNASATSGAGAAGRIIVTVFPA